MKTLSELSEITGYNVVEARFIGNGGYHLLVKIGEGYKLSYYVEGQKMGISLRGTHSSRGMLCYKRKPKFSGNVK